VQGVGLGFIGIGLCLGALRTHNMPGLGFAKHWHCGMGHVHLSSHFGIVRLDGWLLYVSTFMRI
jgi:hypothetical protein